MENQNPHAIAGAGVESVLPDASTHSEILTKTPVRQILADDLNETAIDLDLLKTLIDVAIDLIGDSTKKNHAENLLHIAMRYIPAAESRVSDLVQIAFDAELGVRNA